jgi:hypothetical protein
LIVVEFSAKAKHGGEYNGRLLRLMVVDLPAKQARGQYDERLLRRP